MTGETNIFSRNISIWKSKTTRCLGVVLALGLANALPSSSHSHSLQPMQEARRQALDVEPGSDSPTPVLLVSYGDERYTGKVGRLADDAAKFIHPNGPLTRVRTYNKTDALLLAQSSAETTRMIRDSVGRHNAGWWVWKPLIILDAWEQLPDGGVLIYVDAGHVWMEHDQAEHVLRADIKKLRCYGSNTMLARRFDAWGGSSTSCRVDVARALVGNDELGTFLDASGFEASRLVLVKGEETSKLVREFARHALENPSYFDGDAPLAEPNRPDFGDHRHDQSVLNGVAFHLRTNVLHLAPSGWMQHDRGVGVVDEYYDQGEWKAMVPPSHDQPVFNGRVKSVRNHRTHGEFEPQDFVVGGQPAWWVSDRQCDIDTPDGFDWSSWELAPTAQVKWTCGAGQRNADASECLAAVMAATSGAAGGSFKRVETADVPPGCSFSRVSGAAMFNSGAGQVGSDRENYQLVCKPATSKGGDKVMPPPTRVRARAEALAHDPTVQAHDDSRYLPRLFAMSRAQCAGTQGNFVNGPTKPCNSRGPVCKSGATAASGNDAAVFKPDWAFSSSPCPADKRDAAESECLAAVQVAAKAAGLTDVRSHRMKVIDDVTVSIPSGCTYSPTSRQAIFNRNRVGGNGGTYQRVCADVQEAPDSQRFWYHFECAAYDSVLYIPYQGQGGLDDRIWMLSHASLLATSLCARVVTSTPSTQLPLKHNNWKKVDSRFWWDRYFDLGDLGDGRTIMVSDEERSWLAKDGTSSGDGSSDPLEASIFPQYRIGPSVAANVTEAYEEARMAAVAQTPFTWYADQHVWYPHFWLHKLADYDLGCDKGRTDDFTNPNLDSAFPEFNNGRPWSFFSESRQVRDHATAVLAKLGVHESDLHTLHVRRGDVAENCNTTAAYLALFMSRCDVLSPMKGDTEALVFFTDETDPKYLADLTAALSLPRWGGRVYNGDQAVMDVMGDEDKEDNYFVYAVASSVMASSTRQWEIRSTKGRCEAEDTCANPLMSKADAEAQLQSERREMLARVTSPGH